MSDSITTQRLSPEELKAKNLSLLNLPITINKKALEKAINEKTPDTLFTKGDWTGDDDLKVMVAKGGDIKFYASGKLLHIQIPLQVDFEKEVLLTTITGTGKILLFFESIFDLDMAGQITTRTDISRYQWLEAPQVKVGILDLPFETLIFDIILKRKEKICAQIDQLIQEHLNLRNMLRMAFPNWKEPVPVPGKWPTWIFLQPFLMKIGHFQNNSEDLAQHLGATVSLEVFLKKPELGINQTVSPPLFSLEEKQELDSIVHIKVNLEFEELTKIVQEFVVGKTFEPGGTKVQIKRIHLESEGNKLVIKAAIEGQFTGLLTIKCIPVFDEKTNKFELREVDMQMDNLGFLQRQLFKLFNNKMESMIEASTRMSIKEMLAKAQIKTTGAFNPQDGITVVYDLEHFTVYNLQLTNDAIKFGVQGGGEVSLKVERFKNILSE